MRRLPAAGLLVSAIGFFTGHPIVGVAAYLVSGIVFVLQDAWRPAHEVPPYVRRIGAGFFIVFAVWPVRFAFVVMQRREMLGRGRYGVWIGGSDGEYEYFQDRDEAIVAASQEARRNSDEPTMFTDFGSYAMVDGELSHAFFDVYADGTSMPFPEDDELAQELEANEES